MLHLIACFLLSIFFLALHFVWLSGAMKRVDGLSSMHMLAVSHCVAAALLAVFAWDELPLLAQNLSLTSSLLALGVCMLIARSLYYYAFSKADVSEVSIFSSLTPTYALLIAPLFGYHISLVEALGVILISLSVYCFFLSRKHPNLFHLKNFLSPFKKISASKPLLLTFVSTFPPALAVMFQKDALLVASPYLVSFTLCFIIGISAFIIEQVQNKRLPKQSQGARVSVWKYTVVAGVLQAASVVATSFLLTQMHPASMQAMLRFAIPLQIIMAHIWLGERQRTGWRIGTSLIAIIGGFLIFAGH